MEAKDLIAARSYFEKAKGKRIGMYMSEMRRQYALRMHKDGAKSKHIQAITFLRHDQVWHYLNRYSPDKTVESEVVEHIDEWIEKGLYPISFRVVKDNTTTTDYVLDEDPSYKACTSKNIRVSNKKWDTLINDLSI